MLIIGAGFAGLLAASMCRADHPTILEKQPSLPHNHRAVLRFRSSVVGDTLGVPFRKVQALRAVQTYSNPIADAMLYARKATGEACLRSSIGASGEMVDRWVAPADLSDRIAASLGASDIGIEYGQGFDGEIAGADRPIISTIPMPDLMAILGWEEVPEFSSRPAIHVTADVPRTDAHASLYLPDPNLPEYRVSITGSRLSVELGPKRGAPSMTKENARRTARRAAVHLGLPTPNLPSVEAVRVERAKIRPIDEDLRRRFIMWASREHNIHSLGRFATWRPGLMLDDLVGDVRVIQKLIAENAAARRVATKGR